jgi:hypothetical protein
MLKAMIKAVYFIFENYEKSIVIEINARRFENWKSEGLK